MAYPTLARLNSFPITVLFTGMHSDVTTLMKVKYHTRYCKNLFSSYAGYYQVKEWGKYTGVGFHWFLDHLVEASSLVLASKEVHPILF